MLFILCYSPKVEAYRAMRKLTEKSTFKYCTSLNASVIVTTHFLRLWFTMWQRKEYLFIFFLLISSWLKYQKIPKSKCCKIQNNCWPWLMQTFSRFGGPTYLPDLVCACKTTLWPIPAAKPLSLNNCKRKIKKGNGPFQ